MDDELTPLVEHLRALSGLDGNQSRRLVEEVLAYFDESVEQYVARRHAVRVSTLYASNTAGAAIGVLLVSLLLIPFLGLLRANRNCNDFFCLACFSWSADSRARCRIQRRRSRSRSESFE